VKAAGGGDVPNVKVTVDETAVSAAALGVKSVANPGPHTVRASADGFKPATLSITVPVGGAVDAPLTLEKDLSALPTPPADATAPAQPAAPEPPPATASHSVWPWVAFGVGGVGLGLGVVTGILALGKHSDLSSACTGGCGPDQYANLDSYHTLGALSTAGFIIAGVGAAAGVTLLVLQPKAADATPAGPAASLVVGPGSIAALGRF
jgi:hypothetical protein